MEGILVSQEMVEETRCCRLGQESGQWKYFCLRLRSPAGKACALDLGSYVVVTDEEGILHSTLTMSSTWSEVASIGTASTCIRTGSWSSTTRSHSGDRRGCWSDPSDSFRAFHSSWNIFRVFLKFSWIALQEGIKYCRISVLTGLFDKLISLSVLEIGNLDKLITKNDKILL